MNTYLRKSLSHDEWPFETIYLLLVVKVLKWKSIFTLHESYAIRMTYDRTLNKNELS